jgi:hypothetical protein
MAIHGHLGDNRGVHGGWLALILAGSAFGWVYKRLHYSFLDWRAAIARHKGARRVLRHELLWSAGATVVAILVIKALL